MSGGISYHKDMEKGGNKGRPTDEPKPIRIDIRISENDARILDDYCKRTGKRRPEAIRDGIKSLKEK